MVNLGGTPKVDFLGTCFGGDGLGHREKPIDSAQVRAPSVVINHDPLLSRTHLSLVLLHSHHFGPQASLPHSPLPSGHKTNEQRPVAPPASDLPRIHSSSSGVPDPLLPRLCDRPMPLMLPLPLPVYLATKLREHIDCPARAPIPPRLQHRALLARHDAPQSFVTKHARGGHEQHHRGP